MDGVNVALVRKFPVRYYKQMNDGIGSSSRSEGSERVESPGTYVTE